MPCGLRGDPAGGPQFVPFPLHSLSLKLLFCANCSSIAELLLDVYVCVLLWMLMNSCHNRLLGRDSVAWRGLLLGF
jgi:hypothetical protein